MNLVRFFFGSCFANLTRDKLYLYAAFLIRLCLAGGLSLVMSSHTNTGISPGPDLTLFLHVQNLLWKCSGGPKFCFGDFLYDLMFLYGHKCLRTTKAKNLNIYNCFYWSRHITQYKKKIVVLTIIDSKNLAFKI